MKNTFPVHQFTITQTFLLHLLPGIPTVLLIMIFANPTWGVGLPIIGAVLLGGFFGIVPVQLGVLYYFARREGKKLADVIGYRDNKMTPKATAILVVPCIIFALIIFLVVSPLESILWNGANWIPDWFRLDKFDIDNKKTSMLIFFGIMNLGFNGFIIPFVEELYFRGFLLPRMEALGKGAPFVSSLLFSIYHFFSPWEIVTRFIAATPFIFGTWHKKNIKISILTHCLLNTISGIGMLFMLC